MANTWTCPMCERRVPLREAHCHCGVARERATAAPSAGNPGPETERTRGLWDARLAAGIGVGFALALVATWTPAPEPPPPRRAAARPVVTRPSPRRTPPEPTPVPFEPFDAFEPFEPPAPPPTLGDVAAAAVETPDEPSEVEARRAEGERAAERTAAGLASRLDELERALEAYRRECGHDAGSAPAGGCHDLEKEIVSRGRGLLAELAGARDEARRSWVLPGFVRRVEDSVGLSHARLSSLEAALAELERP